MKQVIHSLALLVFLLCPALAEGPLALVTELRGKASQGGEPLQLLEYAQSDQTIEIKAGGLATFSYVDGGVRVTVTGPCVFKLQSSGPVVQEADKSKVKVVRPDRRVGVALPSNLDLGTGGHLRRGELSLHISPKILPGEQRIAYSALPSFRDFRLTVSNSSSFIEVFQQDLTGSGPFVIPEGSLEPGQSYDFLLQGTTDSGQTMEVEQEAVVVLSEDVAEALRQESNIVAAGNSDFVVTTELLARYLKHGLNLQALQLTEELLIQDADNVQLLDLKVKLRERLGY